MILHLDDTRHISVHYHSGCVWLSSYNGCGTVNPLTPEQAQEIGLAMFQMARKLRRKP